MKKVYFVAAFIGFILPNYFVYQFMNTHGFDLILFCELLFSNYADSAFSIDLLFCSVVFWYFIFNEKKEGKISSIWPFILINLTLGLSLALPLYLYKREDA